MKKAMIPAIVAALVAVGVVVSLTQKGKVRCEVCVTFEGQRQCASARGETREEAERTAQDSACSVIAHGVSDAFACPRVAPDKVTCAD